MISSAGFFGEDSLIMAFCALGNLEIRTVKPNRFKNQSSDTLKLLGQNCNHQQGLIKLSLSITVVLSWNSLNTVIVIAIIDEIVVTGD